MTSSDAITTVYVINYSWSCVCNNIRKLGGTLQDKLEPRKSAVLNHQEFFCPNQFSVAMLQTRISHRQSAVCLIVLMLCVCMRITAEPTRSCANTVLLGQAQGQSHLLKGEIYDQLKDGEGYSWIVWSASVGIKNDLCARVLFQVWIVSHADWWWLTGFLWKFWYESVVCGDMMK